MSGHELITGKAKRMGLPYNFLYPLYKFKFFHHKKIFNGKQPLSNHLFWVCYLLLICPWSDTEVEEEQRTSAR